MYRIAIVNSSSFGKYFPEHIERLKNVGDVERFTLPGDLHGKELADKLMGFNIIVASVTPFYDKEFFEYKDETLLITRHGIGYNNIDIKSATEKGTIVTKVPGIVEREAVAETAVALLMTVIRKIREASLTAREGKWEERAKIYRMGSKRQNSRNNRIRKYWKQSRRNIKKWIQCKNNSLRS